MIFNKTLVLRFDILLSILLFCSSNGFAQGWEWARCASGSFSEAGGDILVVDKDNNIYSAQFFYGPQHNSVILGSSLEESVGSQIVLVKYDEHGDVKWTSHIAGPGTDHSFILNGMQVDSMSNVYVFSRFTGNISIDTFVSSSNIGQSLLLAKYDSNGHLIYAKKMSESAGWSNFCVTPDGKVFVTGSYKSSHLALDTIDLYNTTGQNFFFARLDDKGNAVWAKTMGGPDEDGVAGFAASRDGSLYISGIFKSPSLTIGSTTLTLATIYGTMFLAKFDTAGNFYWAKSPVQYGCFNGVSVWDAKIFCDDFGNFYLNAWGDSVIFDNDSVTNAYAFVAKFDSSGHSKWVRQVFRWGSNPVGYSGASYRFGAADHCGNFWALSGMPSTMITFNSDTLYSPVNCWAPMYAIEYSKDGAVVDFLTLPSGADFVWPATIGVDSKGSVYFGCGYAKGPYVFGADTVFGNNSVFTVKYGMPDLDPFSKMDFSLCHKSELRIEAEIPPLASIIWNNTSSDRFLIVRDTGTFFEVTSYRGCSVSSSFRVTNENCDCLPILPNAFTPNNDGNNDVFCVFAQSICKFNSFIFKVFNRFGNEIFSSNSPAKGWDGASCEAGVYVYYIKYTEGNSDQPHFLNGNVTLIK